MEVPVEDDRHDRCVTPVVLCPRLVRSGNPCQPCPPAGRETCGRAGRRDEEMERSTATRRPEWNIWATPALVRRAAVAQAGAATAARAPRTPAAPVAAARGVAIHCVICRPGSRRRWT